MLLLPYSIALASTARSFKFFQLFCTKGKVYGQLLSIYNSASKVCPSLVNVFNREPLI